MEWIDWTEEDCPNCDGPVSVLTSAKQEGMEPFAFNGDKAKCKFCEWEGKIILVEHPLLHIGSLDRGNLDELNKNYD